MKYIYLTIILSLHLLGAETAIAQNNTLFSSQGYPYKQLISRSDSVKIIYSENQQLVQCRVAITIDNDIHKSKALDVNKNRFQKAPLASCLGREDAKNFLAKSFAK